MGLLELFSSFSSILPELNIHSSMLKDFEKLHVGCTKHQYFFLSVLVLLLSLFLSLLFLYLFFPSALFISLPISLVTFLLVLSMPSIEIKRREALMELEAPFLLRKIAFLLDLGVSFEEILEKLSKEESAFSVQLSFFVQEIRKGASIKKILSSLATQTASTVIKRCVVALLSVYEHGERGGGLRKLSDELLSLQRYSLREFSSKASLFGLVFIVCATIIPTFFLVFSLIGPLINVPISQTQMVISFLILFPALSFFVIILIKSQTPPEIFKEEKENFPVILIFVFGIFSLLIINIFNEYQLPLLLLLSLVLFVPLMRFYKDEERVEKINDGIPDVMFSLAGLPKGSTFERVCREIIKNRHGPLADEFSVMLNQLNSKISTSKVIKDVKEHSKSILMRRAAEMFEYAYTTGADFSEVASKLAEDMLKFFEIRRERANLFSVQKYTLLFGSVLTAVIMGNVFDVLSSISKRDVSFVESSILPAYLIIYSFISSYYISTVEERKTKAVIYMIGMVVGSLGVLFAILMW